MPEERLPRQCLRTLVENDAKNENMETLNWLTQVNKV